MIMADKKLLTIFGATGNQGGSVIDVILANPHLRAKYSLRGVSRNAASESAKSLTAKGVGMVSASLSDLSSLELAVKGSYGVFGVTNFWDKDVMSKTIEIQQGENIFTACKSQNVTHYVFSSLPHAERITNGQLRNIQHFDGKAIVAEFAEENKGPMIVSYFMPGDFSLPSMLPLGLTKSTSNVCKIVQRSNQTDERASQHDHAFQAQRL